MDWDSFMLSDAWSHFRQQSKLMFIVPLFVFVEKTNTKSGSLLLLLLYFFEPMEWDTFPASFIFNFRSVCFIAWSLPGTAHYIHSPGFMFSPFCFISQSCVSLC